MKTRTYQIQDVASIAGVSTRTLRHYDELGLLTPTIRSAAGYRLYTDADLLRLQQILIGRSLGLALEDIRNMYQGDSRFAAYFNNFADGLSSFLSAAMHVNAQRRRD